MGVKYVYGVRVRRADVDKRPEERRCNSRTGRGGTKIWTQ
jgi:hypothetical protein